MVVQNNIKQKANKRRTDIEAMYLSPHVSKQNVAVVLLMQLVFITTNTHRLLSNYWTEDNLQGQQVSVIFFFLLLAKQTENHAL